MKKRYVALPICLLFFWVGTIHAQQRNIYGKLKSESGKEIIGAKITLVEQPSVQTVSNVNGRFSLSAELGQHLRVKEQSHPSHVVAIIQDTMRITLRSADEVPVGYNESRSRDELTAAVGRVKADQLDTRGIIHPGNNLYGKIPGLMVLESSGPPPTNPQIFIRGKETFANNSPLILVDGFERPLSFLSPEAIKSIEVLKDAAAVAMYGQRGANGVLLVTTKRGAPHPLRVHASLTQTVTQPTGLPDFLEAPRYARALNEARGNDGLSPYYSSTDIDAFEKGDSPYFYPNVDWFDQVLRDHGTRSNLNITFDGGGGRARYYALLRYVHDNGIFGPVNQNDDYSTQKKYGQFNFRSNIDVDVTDNLFFRLNVGALVTDENQPRAGEGVSQIMNGLYSIPSAAFPVKTPDGSWGGTQTYGNNPVAILTSTGYGFPNKREIFVDGTLRQDLDAWVKGLSAQATVSYNNFGSYFERKEQQFQYEAISPVRDQGGNIIDTTISKYGQNTDLDYIDSFGDQRRQANIVGKLNLERLYGNNKLKVMALFHQDARVLDGFDNVFHRRNFAANVHYGVNGKYFFNATTSYSGNNYLAKGHRYQFFPAVSAAWLLSKESFLRDAIFLDRLKLRASWGISGNDLLPRHAPYNEDYNTGGGYYFKQTNDFFNGYYETRIPIPDSEFTNESSYKTNLGIDAHLFSKLELALDLFYAKRKNIVTGSGGRISNVLGVTAPLKTDGTVENRGLEARLNWQDAAGDFAYHIGGQFSFARNKIVEMNETYRPYSYLERTGQQVGQRFGLHAIGFFEDQQDIADSPRQLFSEVRPGDIKYKDQNDDGIIDQFDEVPLGYSSGYPEIYFSASLGFNYKGFGVSALFQGTGNHTAYLNTQSVYWPVRANNTISNYYYNNRWTPETSATATFPRLTTVNNDNNYRPNSVWLVDKSYIKLRTLEVSYSLPISFVESLNMDTIRIMAKGRNLFSIDDIPVLDPENLRASYPILRSYSLGIDIAF